MKNYRYRLGKLRGRCPACGRRTLKYYLDTATGEILDPACGRCNRQVKCAYHLRPSEFDRPKRTDWTNRTDKPYRPVPLFDQLAPRLARQNGALLDLNPLFCFMCRRFDAHMLRRVWMDYGATHALHGGGSTAFWLRDSQGRIRSAKVMLYADNGHRVKTARGAAVTYAHTLLGLRDFKYQACFFGEHIAAARPDAAVVVVESEKSALALAAALAEASLEEEYVAVASGGASALNIDPGQMEFPSYRAYFLRGRRVVLLPDADMVDRWRADADTLSRYAASVTLADPRLPPFSLAGSADIADYLLPR